MTGGADARARASDERYDALILCCGSRGDTEPWARLAGALANEGLRVALAAHGEYRTLVDEIANGAAGDNCAARRWPVAFREVAGSLPRALVETPEGAALRRAKGVGALAAARDLMVPLGARWVDSALAAALETKPKLLVATTMVYLAGGFLIPGLLERDAGVTTTLVGAHTVLTHPTGQYAPATAAMGVSLPLACLNRIFWRAGLRVADRALYKPMLDAARARLKVHDAAAPYANWFEYDDAVKAPTILIYSPTLLPRARDWHARINVTGPLVARRARETSLAPATADDALAAAELPANVREYIAAARRAGRPVVYVGLGSMLGALYEDPTQVLAALAGGVALLQQQQQQQQQRAGGGGGAAPPPLAFAAVIHAVTGARGECAEMPPAPAGADYMYLCAPAPHDALLPLVDLAVHHGGMGTTHAVALAGRPAIIAPASLQSDQPFWAAIMQRRGVAVASPAVAGALTPAAFAKLLRRALRALPALSAAAVKLAGELRAEPDGLEAAVGVLRGALTG